jgi:hypothetical protein
MNQAAIFLLAYYTVLTWVPVMLLYFLPDNGWGLAGKVIAVAWLFWLLPRLYFSNPYRPPHLYCSVGVGLVINTLLFAVLMWLFDIDWLRWLLIVVIWFNIFIAHRTVVRGEITRPTAN